MKKGSAMKKLHVKVKPLKLEGGGGEDNKKSSKERMVMLEMNWEGPKIGFLFPFQNINYKRKIKNYSSYKLLKKGEEEAIEWVEEFENICDFLIGPEKKKKQSISSKASSSSWIVRFRVLYVEDTNLKKMKMVKVGEVSLNIGEMASTTNSKMVKKLPITLKVDGVIKNATLTVCISFAEVKNSNEPKEIETICGDKNRNAKEDTESSLDSDDSSSENFSSGNESFIENENANYNMEVQELAPKIGRNSSQRSKLFSWRNWVLSASKRREPFFDLKFASSNGYYDMKKDDDFIVRSGEWQQKELVSRDRLAKLNADVFFASFDQRSQKAAGESACSTLVTVMAHWLQTNQEFMPTKAQFDSLIVEGSLEWQKLCNDEAYAYSFPDNHFDLETILEADLRPLSILHHKSFTGIFNPEKFENLKGAKSFDDIWDEICSSTEKYDHKVYIVSWNDHFFVLKADIEAYYIIDSLGERLFEGCKQAYILKFDESTIMYEKKRKETDSDKAEEEDDTEEIICKGKECCKEYIKRFLAAIPLKELEDEEEKGKVSTLSLLRRLQIDFHYCSSSSSSSSASSSSSHSFSSD